MGSQGVGGVQLQVAHLTPGETVLRLLRRHLLLRDPLGAGQPLLGLGGLGLLEYIFCLIDSTTVHEVASKMKQEKQLSLITQFTLSGGSCSNQQVTKQRQA